MFRKGIDVSVYQQNIEWKKVKKEVDFVIIRGGFSRTVDEYAERNIRGCIENNIPFGLYWFSYATNTELAEQEATTAINLLGGRPITYPIYFDFEYDSANYCRKKGVDVTQELVRTLTKAFCNTIRKHGYDTGFYANPDYISHYYGINFADENKYRLWLAHWGIDEPKYKHDMWQFSDCEFVDGIHGYVDMNYIPMPTGKVLEITMEGDRNGCTKSR